MGAAGLLALVPVVGAASEASVPASAVSDLPPVETPSDAPVVPGQVVVSVDDGADPAAIARQIGAGAVAPVEAAPGLFTFTVDDGDERVVADALDDTAGVAWAEPEAVMVAASAPNDPIYAHQWNLQSRTAANPGGANWEPTWGTTAAGTPLDGRGVTVAIVDSGVRAQGNPDLDGVLAGYDFIDNDADADDGNGHGTHVAGTVAQSTGNGTGPAGVASGATILPVRVLNSSGTGPSTAAISGINYAVANGADVINLSLGAASDAGVCAAVANAVASGVVVIAAAGNEGGAVAYPAACPDAIAVSATTSGATIASYSNRGPQIDIAAPGGDAADRNLDGYADAIVQWSFSGTIAGHYLRSGTSAASPHVAGAAALILQANAGLSPTQVRAALTGSAADLGAAGVDDLYGAGLLDVAAAVGATGGQAPAPTTTAPTTPTTAAPVTTLPPTTTTTRPSTTTTTTRPPSSTTTTTAAPTPWSGLPVDVPSDSTHAGSIAKVIDAGIAQGYPDGTYRPGHSVTRGQMATFIARGLGLLDGAAADDAGFPDTAGSPHATAINAIAEAGITAGYADGTFGPNDPVSRGQMATFLTRALHLPPGPAPAFDDVARSAHADAIAAVASAGIASGYTDGTFRPTAPVTRAQMATFFVRALRL